MMRKHVVFSFLTVALIVLCSCVVKQSRLAVSPSPPDWLIGCWANIPESDPSECATIWAGPQGITIKRGIHGRKVQLAKQFAGYAVKASTADDCYSLTFHKQGDTVTYLFRYRPIPEPGFGAGPAITIQVSRNGADLGCSKVPFLLANEGR